MKDMPSLVDQKDSTPQLSALRSDYESGTLTKGDYIREIWEIHQRLFEYSGFLHGTNVEAIEINKDGVVMCLKDPRLKLWLTRRDQRHVAIESLNFGRFESEELDAVTRLGKPCNVFFDIGTNVGIYSIALAQRIPGSKVISFEPIPATYQELKRNLALNHIENVEAHNMGLSDRSHNAPFYFDASVTGAASGAPLGSEFSNAETLTCPVETLDEFVNRTGFGPDLIKCDVEGGELKVFLGATKTLDRFKPIVFTEMLRKWAARFGYHPNEIIELFGSLGYQCFVLSGGMLEPFLNMTDQTLETNFFFLHSQRHIEMVRFLGLLK